MAARPTAAPSMVVEVAGLVKRYGGRAVIDGIDLAVGRGELVAILGPNGAGKTTTIEIIEGYRRPDAGSVRVLGVDPGRAGRAHRARVGVMLQSGGIDPRARPRELLELYGAFFADPWPAGPLLDVVGLGGVAATPYRRLSGGERQRLSLSLALVGRPDLLVLDEPTAGLDPAARAATRELIAGLRAEGVTILLTTHDLGDVEQLADRVAILDRGRIVALGSPGELTAGGGGRVRVRFARPLDAGARRGLAAAVADAGAQLAEDARTSESAPLDIDTPGGPDPALVARIAAWAADTGRQIVELRVGTASLEERYLELTGDLDVGGAAATDRSPDPSDERTPGRDAAR